MRIKRQHPKLDIKNDYSDNDLKLIRWLEEDSILELRLKDIRRNLLIPVSGINPENKAEAIKYLPKNNEDLIKLYLDVIKLLTLFKLPPRWYSTFVSLILFNVTIPPDDSLTLEIQCYGKNDTKIGFGEVRIIIREKMSWDRLKRILTKKKKILDEAFANLPENPDVRKTNISLMKTINKIKENNPLITDEELAYKLNERYEAQTIDKPYHKKRINQIEKRKLAYLKKYLNTNTVKNILYHIARPISSYKD